MVMDMPEKRRGGRPRQRSLDNIRTTRVVGKRLVRGGRARPGEMEASH